MKRKFAVLLTLLFASASAPARAEPPSVLLITIDTLRADRLGCSGHGAVRASGGSITPHIDRLARGGRLWMDASAQAPLTLPSHASILTGLDPLTHGLRNNGGAGLAASFTTLAERLHAAGFTTAAFVGAFPLNRVFKLDQGFQLYDDRTAPPDAAHFLYAERPGGEVVAAAEDWLRRLDAGRPFFLWAHLYDPHAPYQPAAPHDRLDSYDGEVEAVDRLVGRLAAAARATGKRVLLVLTSDHGEAFGEHGEVQHGIFLYQSTLHVPLLVGFLDAAGPGRIEAAAAQSLDVVPTVLEALGLGVPPELPGRSLLGPQASAPARPFLLESLAPLLDYGWHELIGLRQGRWKLVRAPRPELYDLWADPGELQDLHAARSEAVRELEAGLDRLLAERAPAAAQPDPASGAAQESAAPPDPETAAALASLGYASGSGAPPPAAARPDPKDRVETVRELGLAAAEPPQQAIPRLEALLLREPGNSLARQRLGWLLYFAGRFDEARPQFERLVRDLQAAGRLQRGAVPVEVALGLADCQSRSGRREEALATLRGLVSSVDRPAWLLLNLGRHLQHAGRPAEAEAALRQGLELEPQLPELHEALRSLRP